MPKGYIVGHMRVTDPDSYKEFVQRFSPLLASYGGAPIVRGGRSESLEGPDYDRHVTFEFPDYESARQMYYSAEYQEIMTIRQAAADSMIVLVEGVA